MSKEWSEPAMHISENGNVGYWETKTLASVPDLDQHVPKDDAAYLHYKAEAEQYYRVPDNQQEPWGWVCKIYVRLPAANPAVGAPLLSQWITGSAWLVQASHEPGQKGQWLTTAAHNFLDTVPMHDKGKVTNPVKSVTALADAVYIEAGWGPNRYSGWADSVAVMKGFYDNMATNIHLDGAAFHIKDSSIPTSFWERAPPAVTFGGGVEPVTLLVAGFPGAINTYPDLKGLYLTGKPKNATPHSLDDFDLVNVVKEDASGPPPGRVVLKYPGVNNAEGFSGGPVVIGPEGDRCVPASVQTHGIGALIVTQNHVGADIMTLMETIKGHVKQLQTVNIIRKPGFASGWCQLL